MRIVRARLAACLLVALCSMPVTAAVESPEAGDAAVELFFFWSARCPHCQRARPFVEALPARHPWLRLHSLDVSQDQANARRYVEMAAALGETAQSVPGFIFCGNLHTGYATDETTGQFLEGQLAACHAARREPAAGVAAAPAPVHVPLLGELDPMRYSLPALTLVLGGLDSFNPCAFFVLLFLLSLLVHARSRARILLVGGTFVFFSGLVYLVFMAAWLNVFLLVGEVAFVTTAAGLVATALAVLSVKEYFWFKVGPSLTIPESAKPGLFQRMRGLVSADSLPTILLGTVVLALAANAYELLCTAGFPMVYTRVLTLSELSTGQHYLYLVLYNLVYVTPLLGFVVLFAFTLGSRKLGEREGRVLKLVSGLMMLQLGVALLLKPELLGHVLAAVAMLVVSVLVAAALEGWRRRRDARLARPS